MKRFENPKIPKQNSEDKAPTDIDMWSVEGAEVAPGERNPNAHTLRFRSEESGTLTTIQVLQNDYSGSDLVITNMTTLPPTERSKGHGAQAVSNLLAFAKSNGMKEVRASQVQPQSEAFWMKRGFHKEPGENPTNNFVILLT